MVSRWQFNLKLRIERRLYLLEKMNSFEDSRDGVDIVRFETEKEGDGIVDEASVKSESSAAGEERGVVHVKVEEAFRNLNLGGIPKSKHSRRSQWC